jgi:hypothetical protein
MQNAYKLVVHHIYKCFLTALDVAYGINALIKIFTKILNVLDVKWLLQFRFRFIISISIFDISVVSCMFVG